MTTALSTKHILKLLAITACLWLFGVEKSNAQYDPLYYQYQFNTLAINPAYAGSRDLFSSVLISRNQWMGFDGAPVTQSLSLHSPISNKYTSLGLSATHDQTGPMSQTLLFGDYAFRFNISAKTRLAFGLSAGFNQLTVDYNSLDRSPGTPDAAYDEGVLSKFMPNFGFGAYLNHPSYFLGLSVPRLIENDFASTESGNAVLAGGEKRTYFMMAGAILNLSPQLKLKPAVMTRMSSAAPPSTDINLNLLIREQLWTGIMYRPGSAWGATVQYQLSPQFKFGYAFEATTNDLQTTNSGTHELMLMYELHFKKQKVYSPRYF
jgi:type IX secretion system PorP/SprF family membrane protein